MGQSKTQRRRQQRNKKKKAAAGTSGASAAVTSSEPKPSRKLWTIGRTNYHDDLKWLLDSCSQQNPYVPELVPRFPQERETLSLDDGFAQTPDLKFISSYYNFKPSEAQRDLETSHFLYRDSYVPISINNTNLGVVYSEIAPSVVAVSSFLGVERKWECSGLVIHWSSAENEATILTSTKLLSNPEDTGFEFHLVVRMADGTLLLGKEDYVDYYHNILTLKVKSMAELEVVDLRSRQANIVDEMHAISLGRSFYTHSLYDFHGKLYPQLSPIFGCDELLQSTCSIIRMCEGGPLVTDTGCVIGINFKADYIDAHTLPTPIILSCLEMWTSFRTVVQPWFGMSFIDVNQLCNHERKEFNISTQESYVVVKKVYEGSIAEKSNVRSYDSVTTLNGTLIESVKQYYQLLSEASRAAISCDSAQRLTVGINRFDRRTDGITIEGDYVSVDDHRLCVCWPRAKGDEWLHGLLGSGKNPSFRWLIKPEDYD